MGSHAAAPGLLERLPVALSVFDGAGAIFHKSGGLKSLIPDLAGVPDEAIRLGWEVFALDGTPLAPTEWPDVRIIEGDAVAGHTIGRLMPKAGAAEPIRTFVCSVTPRAQGGGTAIIVEVGGLAGRIARVPDLHDLVDFGLSIPVAAKAPAPAELGSNEYLTKRERSVLQLIAWGHTFKEIAKLLAISPKTAEAHRASAMKRVGLSSRNEIVRYAVEQGWFREEPPFVPYRH